MKKIALILTALAALSAPMRAEAIDRTGKIAIGLGAGYNMHAMTDMNDIINNAFGGNTKITGGLGADVDVKWHALKNLVTGLELELIQPQTRETTFGGLGKVTESYTAMAISLNCFYAMPVENVDYRVGLGLGLTTTNGATIKSEGLGSTTTDDVKGSGFSLKVGVGADWYLTKNWSLNADLGYRLSALSPFTIGGGSDVTKVGSADKASLDYSGLFTKFGASYWF